MRLAFAWRVVFFLVVRLDDERAFVAFDGERLALGLLVERFVVALELARLRVVFLRAVFLVEAFVERLRFGAVAFVFFLLREVFLRAGLGGGATAVDWLRPPHGLLYEQPG